MTEQLDMEKHIERVAEMTAKSIIADKVDPRLDILEAWKNEQRINAAVGDERKKYMEERFNKIDSELASIKNSFWKFFWVIAAGMAAYVVNFVMSGGLVIGT